MLERRKEMKAVLDQNLNVLDEFVKIFGNEEKMKNNFPKTYEAYINSRDIIMRSSDRFLENEKSIPKEFDIEVVHVSYTDESKKYVQVDLRATASDQKGYCILRANSPQAVKMAENLNLSENSAMVLEDVCCDFTGDQEEVSLQFPAELFQTDGKNALNTPVVEVVAELYTVDDKVVRYESRELLNLYALKYSSEITIDAPKRTHKNQENKDINIAYRYKGGQFTEKLLDYFYSSKDLQDGNLRIPSKGKICVKGVNLHKVSSVTLIVVNDKGEGFCHNDAEVKLADSHTITWNMPDNWGNPYGNVLDSLYCYVTYQLEIRVVASGKQHTFVVTNNQKAKPALNKKIIERINIYKDCFEAGVMLRMGDGSEKKVENITKGDSLKTPDGIVKVQYVQEISMVTAMVHIKGENGRELSISCNHPLVTDKGLVCAKFLQEGDEVYTEDGVVKIMELCVTPGVELTLYHIEMESCHRLYANGFLAGDSMAELDAAERANNLLYQVPEEWRKDYKSWVKQGK